MCFVDVFKTGLVGAEGEGLVEGGWFYGQVASIIVGHA